MVGCLDLSFIGTKLFLVKVSMFLNFISYLDINMAQVVEIHPKC